MNRTERLDVLPFTRRHGRLLFGSGIGWALDAMDVGLISFVMTALIQQKIVTPGEAGWLASIGFAGMAVGAALGGLIADRIGRRQVFALTLVVYGLATGAMALATGAATLMIFRFIVGLGLGAELPIASTLVSEYAPRKIRGRVVVWLEAFWAVGWILAAIIGTTVVTAGDNGWRWALVVGIVPALYAIVVRLHLPESVRFLESKGRHDEAERAVREFERAAGVDSDAAAARPTEPEQPESGVVEPAIETTPGTRERIWSPRLRRRTTALWVVWFCINFSYYGAFVWIPSLLVGQGFSLVTSFTFTLIITLAQLPGYAVSAWLIELWGRRATLAVFLAGSAVSAISFGVATSETAIIVSGCLLSFFNLGAWGALYAIGPELYPTAIRATGTGAAAAFGRTASILAPLLVPVMLTVGQWLVFAVFAVAFAIAAASALVLPERRGAKLDASPVAA